MKKKKAENELYPIYYNGKEYYEEDCNDVFAAYYTCPEALNVEGGVYVSEGTWIYPDGRTEEW